MSDHLNNEDPRLDPDQGKEPPQEELKRESSDPSQSFDENGTENFDSAFQETVKKFFTSSRKQRQPTETLLALEDIEKVSQWVTPNPGDSDDLIETLEHRIKYGELLVVYGASGSGKRTAVRWAALNKTQKSGGKVLETNADASLQDCIDEIAAYSKSPAKFQSVIIVQHDVTDFRNSRGRAAWSLLANSIAKERHVSLVCFWGDDIPDHNSLHYWNPHFDWRKVFKKVLGSSYEEGRLSDLSPEVHIQLQTLPIAELTRHAHLWANQGFDNEWLVARLRGNANRIAEQLLNASRSVSERVWVISACFLSGADFAAVDDCAKRLTTILAKDYEPTDVSFDCPRRLGRLKSFETFEGSPIVVGKVLDLKVRQAVLDDFQSVCPGAYEALVEASGEDRRSSVSEVAAFFAANLSLENESRFELFEQSWIGTETEVYERFMHRAYGHESLRDKVITALRKRLLASDDESQIGALRAIVNGVGEGHRVPLFATVLSEAPPSLLTWLCYLACVDGTGGIGSDLLLAKVSQLKSLEKGELVQAVCRPLHLCLNLRKDAGSDVPFQIPSVSYALARLIRLALQGEKILRFDEIRPLYIVIIRFGSLAFSSKSPNPVLLHAYSVGLWTLAESELSHKSIIQGFMSTFRQAVRSQDLTAFTQEYISNMASNQKIMRHAYEQEHHRRSRPSGASQS